MKKKLNKAERNFMSFALVSLGNGQYKEVPRLKPCPFCGSDEIIDPVLQDEHGEYYPVIMCDDCGGAVLGATKDMDLDDPYENLRKVWNRRV